MNIKLAKLSNHLYEADYTIDEEAEVYDRQLDDILKNTREYLDNFQ